MRQNSIKRRMLAGQNARNVIFSGRSAGKRSCRESEKMMPLAFSDSLTRILDEADRLDPETDRLFERAYHQAHPHPLLRWLSRPAHPLLRLAANNGPGGGNRRFAGLRAVALDQIVGSLDKAEDFDRSFRPLQRHSENRWRAVATAMLRGQQLPPVTLIQVGDAYYVVDGHHRISVARALGYQYLEAEIFSWDAEISDAA